MPFPANPALVEADLFTRLDGTSWKAPPLQIPQMQQRGVMQPKEIAVYEEEHMGLDAKDARQLYGKTLYWHSVGSLTLADKCKYFQDLDAPAS